METTPTWAHPVQFAVDYPDRPLNRLTTFFRLILAIPIFIVLASVSGGGWHYSYEGATYVGTAAGGLLFIPPLLMLLFREKYPQWWFNWNLELLRFSNRVTVYVALMDDRYPSTDEQQSVRLDIPDPRSQRLNRWLPLVKWFLAIPHYIVLIFLGIAAFFVIVIAWFAILFTGRYPRALFDFVAGFLRWNNRVTAYAFILATDRYPPFRFAP